MTFTVVESDVQAVTGTQDTMAPFIATANAIYDNTLQSKGLSDDLGKQVVIYLAAHFWCLTFERGGLAMEQMSVAQEQYRVIDGREIGLASTRFGQQAMLLDPSGALAGLSTNRGLKAQFQLLSRVQCS